MSDTSAAERYLGHSDPEASNPGPSSRFGGAVARSVAFVAVLMVGRWWTLDEPVSWDAVYTTVVGADFLANNSFDVRALQEYGQRWYGADWIRAWSPVTLLDALVARVSSSADLIATLRVVHVVISGVAVAAVYGYCRITLSRTAASAATLITMAVPVFLAQTSFIYFEIPMLAAVLMSAKSAVGGHTVRCSLWAALATSIKSAGIFAAVGIAVELLLRRRDSLAVKQAIGIVLPSALASLPALTNTSQFGDTSALHVISGSLGSLLAVGPVSTVVIIFATWRSAVLLLAGADGARSDRVAAAMVLSFLGLFFVAPIFGQPQAMFPRYLVAILPFAVYLAVRFSEQVVPSRARAALLVSVLAVAFLNGRGDLAPAPRLPIIAMQERSDRHLDLLQLQNDALLQAVEYDMPVLVHRNLWMRSQLPVLGVVDSPIQHVEPIADETDLRALPDVFAIVVSGSAAHSDHELAELATESGEFVRELRPVSGYGFELSIQTFRRIP